MLDIVVLTIEFISIIGVVLIVRIVSTKGIFIIFDSVIVMLIAGFVFAEVLFIISVLFIVNVLFVSIETS